MPDSTDILRQMERVDQEIAQLQQRLLQITTIHGDYQSVYRENKQLLQENSPLLYPLLGDLGQICVFYSPNDCPEFRETVQKCQEQRPKIIQAISKIKLQERSAIHSLNLQYKQQYHQWITVIERQEAQKASEAEIRNQIINNAIREDFIQAQAQLGALGTGYASGSAFFGRRRGPIGDVVRSEEEMNIVLRDLMEQEKRSLAARWTNTLAVIPEMRLTNSEHCNLSFLDSNRICDPIRIQQNNLQEFQRARSWTTQEVQTFVEKYAAFPKMFGKISSWLPGRSAEECVKFYYCNKKRLHLKAAKGAFVNVGTAVYGNGSLSLGTNTSSTVPVSLGNGPSPKRFGTPNSGLEPAGSSSGKRGRKKKEEERAAELAQSQEEDSSASSAALALDLWTAEEKAKFAVAIKLFGKNWTLIADYLDYSKREKECREYFEGQFTMARKKQHQNLQSGKESKKMKSSEATLIEDPAAKKKQLFSHYWTKEEKRAFSDAFSKFGKNWDTISQAIKSKSANQAKKFFKKNKNLFEGELLGEKEKAPEELSSTGIEEDVDIEDFASSSPLPLQSHDPMPVIKLPTLF